MAHDLEEVVPASCIRAVGPQRDLEARVEVVAEAPAAGTEHRIADRILGDRDTAFRQQVPLAVVDPDPMGHRKAVMEKPRASTPPYDAGVVQSGGRMGLGRKYVPTLLPATMELLGLEPSV